MKYLVFGTNSYVKKIKEETRYCVIGALAKSVDIDFKGIRQNDEIEELLEEKQECVVQLKKKFKFRTSFMIYLQKLNDNAMNREYLSFSEKREKNWKVLSNVLRKKNLYNKVKRYATKEVES